MTRHRSELIDSVRMVDLNGGTPDGILSVLDNLVEEPGLGPDEVRALRDALAEAIEATEQTEEREHPPERGAPLGERDPGVYLDVEGLAQVSTASAT